MCVLAQQAAGMLVAFQPADQDLVFSLHTANTNPEEAGTRGG